MIFFLSGYNIRSKKTQRLIPLLLIIGCANIFCSSTSYAREWYIQPDFTQRIEVDDNILLREETKNDVIGLRSTFSADYGTRTDTSEINFLTDIDVYKYWGQDNLDRVNVNWGEQSFFQVTEKNKIGLDAAYVRDNTVTSELDVTGLTQNPIPREMYNVAPHWAYRVAELQTLQSNYKHEQVDYNTTGTRSSLTSYITDTINLSYLYQWREDTQVYIAASALWYQVTDFNQDVQNYSINAGFDYQFSETLSFNFMAGVRFSSNQANINGVEAKDSSIGSVYSIGLNKRFELGAVNINYSRDISPSSVGRLLQVDRFQFDSSYNLTEHFSVMLLAGINQTTSTADDGRVYYFVEPKLRWRFNRQANINAGYRFRMQEYDNRDSTAVSNGLYMSINYQWDSFSSNRF